MNYNILNYIIAVAEEENFTKAAKKLYISQPSLSQIIKKEEDKLGVKLFDRIKSPVTLTQAGQEYILWAKQILSMYQKMEKRLREYSTDKKCFLKIGILPESSGLILATPLRFFRENHPNAFVQIHELSSSELKLSLENSDLDFIVGLTHPDKYKYYSEVLYEEKIVLAVTPEFSPLNEEITEVDLADFSEAPFVMMEEGQFLYNVSHDLCEKNGFVPKTVVECYNLETALNFVKAGVGVSLIPDLMSYIVGGLNYYNIKGPTPESQIAIVYKKDDYLISEAKELITLIKSNVRGDLIKEYNKSRRL